MTFLPYTNNIRMVFDAALFPTSVQEFDKEIRLFGPPFGFHYSEYSVWDSFLYRKTLFI